MKLCELQPAPGSKTSPRRVGRGIGSGLGKTCGKGSKGQGAHAGKTKGNGFEGGQMPIARRIPKRGFTNIFATNYACINISALEQFDKDTVVTPELLLSTGLVRQLQAGIKILGDGELTKALTVKAKKFTKSAEEKIKAAGGTVEVL